MTVHRGGVPRLSRNDIVQQLREVAKTLEAMPEETQFVAASICVGHLNDGQLLMVRGGSGEAMALFLMAQSTARQVFQDATEKVLEEVLKQGGIEEEPESGGGGVLH